MLFSVSHLKVDQSFISVMVVDSCHGNQMGSHYQHFLFLTTNSKLLMQKLCCFQCSIYIPKIRNFGNGCPFGYHGNCKQPLPNNRLSQHNLNDSDFEYENKTFCNGCPLVTMATITNHYKINGWPNIDLRWNTENSIALSLIFLKSVAKNTNIGNGHWFCYHGNCCHCKVLGARWKDITFWYPPQLPGVRCEAGGVRCKVQGAKVWGARCQELGEHLLAPANRLPWQLSLKNCWMHIRQNNNKKNQSSKFPVLRKWYLQVWAARAWCPLCTYL